MDAKTGYIPNLIPLSVFFLKPVGSMDWRLASNESMFSHVSLSREHGMIGLAAALRLDETQKSEDNDIKGEEHKLLVASGKLDEENEEEVEDGDGEKIKPEESNETVNERTETNTVLSLPLVNESRCAESDNKSKIEEMIKLNCKEHDMSNVTGKNEEKETVEDDGHDMKEIKPEDLSESVNQIIEASWDPLVDESQNIEKSAITVEQEEIEDDGNEMKEIKRDNSNHITMINSAPPSISQDTEQSNVTCKQEEKEETEDDVDDVMETILDDSSICCRSDTSNNSISSFTFPILHNEDGSVKTPSMELIWNVFDKRLELSQPQPHPHPQFYFIPAAHTQTQQPPQRKSSSLKLASETQSQKAFRNRWLSCFCFPFQRN